MDSSKPPERILLIEDTESLRQVIKNLLELKGYKVQAFETAEDALAAFTTSQFHCVIADFKLPGMSGLDLLAKIRHLDKSIPYLIMTAYGSVNIAVKAMKDGANDFIEKPFDPENFLAIIADLIKYKQIMERRGSSKLKRDRRIITKDPQMLAILDQAARVGRVTSPVLITGESGTGKELLARFIHEQSPRKDLPFVAINCAAIPKDLIESELFGHEAGSFTGATQQRIGLLEYASKGTVFLDEVGDMPLNLQVKLLRALQEQEIRRVGGNKTIAVEPRIIAATNRDIAELCSSGLLREDFYYRLAVVTLELAPLRKRVDDIELLAQEYTRFFCHLNGRAEIKLSREALSWLKKYPWPGNIRELENVMERAVLMAEKKIQPEHLGIDIETALNNLGEASSSLVEISQLAVRQAEIQAISKILAQTRGNKSKAAELLGVSYKTLLHKVKEYSL